MAEQDNQEESKDFKLELLDFDPQKQEDHLWQEQTGLTPTTLAAALETLIFMQDRPISLLQLRELIHPNLPLRAIHQALERLQQEYEQEHHGIRLQEVAQGYQFRTKSLYSKFVQDLFKASALVLTPAALEVLAIIAYSQPVGKNEIEKIRGIDSSHMIRTLLDKRLIKMMGRSEEWGRPILYGTTNEFLEVFNLKDLRDLPPEHDLQSLAGEQEVGVVENIRQAVQSLERQDFSSDALEELDEISKEIKAIPADTPFTRTLRLEAAKKFNKAPVAEGEEPPPPPRTAYEILEEHVTAALAKESAPSGENAAGQTEVTEEQKMFPENDKQALADALDQVFDKMKADATENETTNANSSSSSEELRDELNFASVDEKTTALDNKTNEMAQKAASLELNLDFLKDSPIEDELLKNLTKDKDADDETSSSSDKA